MIANAPHSYPAPAKDSRVVNYFSIRFLFFSAFFSLILGLSHFWCESACDASANALPLAWNWSVTWNHCIGCRTSMFSPPYNEHTETDCASNVHPDRYALPVLVLRWCDWTIEYSLCVVRAICLSNRYMVGVRAPFRSHLIFYTFANVVCAPDYNIIIIIIINMRVSSLSKSAALGRDARTRSNGNSFGFLELFNGNWPRNRYAVIHNLVDLLLICFFFSLPPLSSHKMELLFNGIREDIDVREFRYAQKRTALKFSVCRWTHHRLLYTVIRKNPLIER